MRLSRFGEEQMIGILREQGGGCTDSGCVPAPRVQHGDLL